MPNNEEKKLVRVLRAINKVEATRDYSEYDHNIFFALLGVLGVTELYDGIATSMEDNNLENLYYDIVKEYENGC